nr:retrovirus-related Pol polyprotein from transposon TNT 1-94 [Tanacetum cinerariifolium]
MAREGYKSHTLEEITQSPGESSNTSEGSKNSRSFEDSERSDEEYFEDGASYKEEAMKLHRKESVQWKKDINEEMVSLEKNQTCSLVRLLVGKKASERLWMFRVKKEQNGRKRVKRLLLLSAAMLELREMKMGDVLKMSDDSSIGHHPGGRHVYIWNVVTNSRVMSSWREIVSLTFYIMASAIICLANNQKFNFSKYILDNMVKNLEAGVKFYMFPRFVQVFVNHQLGDISHHKGIFFNPSLTKKGRINDKDLFGVNDLDGDEVIVDVTAGENVDQDTTATKKEVSIVANEVVTTTESVEGITAATTLQISKDDVTLAQTLIEIKEAKPKARGVIVQEPSEFRTTSSLQPSQLAQAKDK